MLNTAIVGLGWWGKTLVKAARDFGAPINFVRGVTLEPDTVRDFAAEYKIPIGTSFDEVLADPAAQQRIAQSQQEIARGEGLSLDQVEQLMAERSGRHGA